jgi:aerobic carbon-monoxide dehydrogenase medium subunit
VRLLDKFGEDAKVLAGGHSLIPLMRLRLAQPKALVDINGIKELDHIKADGPKLRIGALTRHVEIQNSDVVKEKLPILAEVAAEVGDNQVRNMGTMGGVVAHADAAGDYPTIALILDAEIVTNKRTIQAKDFFKDIFTTPLAADEIVTEVVFPVADGPHKYIKFRRRLFDWAIVGAAAQKMNGGWRIGLTNVGPTPVRAKAVEDALQNGAKPEEAAQHASDGLNPSGDLRASPEYKKHLSRVLTKRAIEQAT